MLFFRKLFKSYIQSSIHVAIAVMCLVYITDFSAHFKLSIIYPSCVFFGTIVGYNFLKYFEIFRTNRFHNKKYYKILIVTIISSFGFLFFWVGLERNVQMLIFVSGLLVLTYPLLRKYGWLKIFLVSFVITFISVYIPFQIQNQIGTDCYINLMQRFLILISLLIPFEILDSKTDNASLQTLPQQFGINNAKIFGFLLIIPFIILEFMKANSSSLVLPIGIMTMLFIHFSSVDRNKYYTSFWVESVPIFWLLLWKFIALIP
jgi:hypothetical protein